MPRDDFARTLASSAARGVAADSTPRDIERYLEGLHLEDLGLACGCAAGDAEAWDHFVLQQRPFLYRAADALEPGGNARDLADSLYAELYGLRERSGERQSLFRYFHGRSSLTTWLRAVLAQRCVDRVRMTRREEMLPDDESAVAVAAPQVAVDPDRVRFLLLMQAALKRAVAKLAARDRLRLSCYYAQELTLAQTARILGEHEATASRQLARTRKLLREDVERDLRAIEKLTDVQIAECFASVSDDPGPLNLSSLLTANADRKESAVDRSR